MISSKQLSIGYQAHGRKGKTNAIHTGLNFSLNRGELVCLIGENGAGKSTLIKTLCGFIPPISGELFVDDTTIINMSSKQIAEKIGVVLSNAPNLDNMLAYEVVCMGRFPFTGMFGKLTDSDYVIVDDAIKIVGVENLKYKYFNMMSDGEKQKTMIAKVIAQQTPYIIMDEPMAFLDYPSRIDMMSLLKKLSHEHNKAVLLSTHNLEMALKMTDKLWIMNSQNNFLQTTDSELLEKNLLEKYFNKETADWITATQ